MFPKLIHLRVDTCAVAFLFAILLAPSDVYAVVPFDYPLVDGMWMDGCLGFATDCEQTAADYFCQIRGYTDASDWNTENSPSDTKSLKTKDICHTSQYICGRFSFIDCEIDNTVSLSPDDALAQQYAPVLRLSGPGNNRGVDLGVNLRTSDTPDYPYTDYIPIDIHDINSHPAYSAMFVTRKDGLLEKPLSNAILDEIGGSAYNDTSNYVSLAPVWNASNVEQEYKRLTLSPRVYYRVRRMDPAIDRLYIAIQYWFFIFTITG